MKRTTIAISLAAIFTTAAYATPTFELKVPADHQAAIGHYCVGFENYHAVDKSGATTDVSTVYVPYHAIQAMGGILPNQDATITFKGSLDQTYAVVIPPSTTTGTTDACGMGGTVTPGAKLVYLTRQGTGANLATVHSPDLVYDVSGTTPVATITDHP